MKRRGKRREQEMDKSIDSQGDEKYNKFATHETRYRRASDLSSPVISFSPFVSLIFDPMSWTDVTDDLYELEGEDSAKDGTVDTTSSSSELLVVSSSVEDERKESVLLTLPDAIRDVDRWSFNSSISSTRSLMLSARVSRVLEAKSIMSVGVSDRQVTLCEISALVTIGEVLEETVRWRKEWKISLLSSRYRLLNGKKS